MQGRGRDAHPVTKLLERGALGTNRHLCAAERVGVLIGDNENVHATRLFRGSLAAIQRLEGVKEFSEY